MLLHVAEGLINSGALVEDFMWQILSGSFFDFFRGIREYNLDFIASRTASYHCIYLRQDGKCAISSLNVIAIVFLNFFSNILQITLIECY